MSCSSHLTLDYMYFYVCLANWLCEAGIGGQKAKFAYPGTVLKFLRCVSPQDIYSW